MNRRFQLPLCTFTMTLLTAFPGHAQTVAGPLASAAADVSPADLAQQVIVTATRSPRALSDVPVSASVVTSEQIQDTAARSLDDVLRHVAGVNLPIQTGTQAHPTSDNASMRGLGGIRALVLVDGVPINDPFFGYVQWARIPLETIDHVEIMRGGGSPLWGNYAMGGAINVITRADTADTAVIDAGVGSDKTYRTNVYGSHGLAPSNRVAFTANLDGTDGFMAVPGYARRPFDRPTRFSSSNFQLSDRYKAADDLAASFSVTHHENEQRLGTLLSTNAQSITAYVASVKKDLGAGDSLSAALFHGVSRFVTRNPTVVDATLPLADQTEHKDNVHTTPFVNTGGSLLWSKDVGGWLKNVTLGADFNNVRGSDSAAIFDKTGTNQIRIDYGSAKESFAGAFVQASIAPLKRLEILASGRLQRFAVLDGYDGNPGGAGFEPDRRYTSFDPRLSVGWAQTEHLALRAAAYKSFRAPTLDNLYRGFAADGGIYYPNSQLKPESLTGGELGLDYSVKYFRSRFTLYRTRITNLITTADLDSSQLPQGFLYGGRLVNAASARAQGLEAEAAWVIGNGFSTTLDYTLADSRYRSNPEDPQSVGRQLQDVPRNTVSAALAYQSRAGWHVATDARWITRTSWTSADHADPGFPYQACADAHLVVDLAARYPLGDHADVLLQFQNLFGRRYIVNPGPWNAPQFGTPFQVFVGLRYTLG